MSRNLDITSTAHPATMIPPEELLARLQTWADTNFPTRTAAARDLAEHIPGLGVVAALGYIDYRLPRASYVRVYEVYKHLEARGA